MAIGYSSNNLEAFVDAVKLNSFSAVARRRGLTASSVARQVSALEKELGISLFIRTTRALTLTAAGRTLFDRADTGLLEMLIRSGGVTEPAVIGHVDDPTRPRIE